VPSRSPRRTTMSNMRSSLTRGADTADDLGEPLWTDGRVMHAGVAIRVGCSPTEASASRRRRLPPVQ
jgi:hypothetical protein